MKSAPVSVIIPTFRDGDALRRALASVLGQTSPPCEIIIVDDAGGEISIGSILNDLGSSQVTLIKLDRNVGPGAARNAGIQASGQPLIAFLDADDEWHHRKLELQVDSMQTSGLDFCAHRKSFAGAPWSEVAYAETRRFSRWRVLRGNPASISTVMMKRNAIQFVFPEWYAGEDYAFVGTNLLAGIAAGDLPVALTRAFKNPFGDGGLSARNVAMQLGEMRVHLLLRQLRLISLWECILLVPWSLIKFLRRLAIIALRAAGKSN